MDLSLETSYCIKIISSIDIDVNEDFSYIPSVKTTVTAYLHTCRLISEYFFHRERKNEAFSSPCLLFDLLFLPLSPCDHHLTFKINL